jgi:hypothetical protein
MVIMRVAKDPLPPLAPPQTWAPDSCDALVLSLEGMVPRARPVLVFAFVFLSVIPARESASLEK